MKKEKFYSFIYAFVLLGILGATTLKGQLAYNDVTLEFEKDHLFTPKPAEATVNTAAIGTISEAIKQDLHNLKSNGTKLESGKWFANVVITVEGKIGSVKIDGSRINDFHNVLKGIVENVETVDPITYNGVAKEKIVRIPVVLTQS